MLFSAIYDIYIVIKEYNTQALSAAMVAILLYIAIMAVVFVVQKRRGYKSKSVIYLLSKLAFTILFGIYFSYLVFLTLSGREAGSRGEIMNIIPFATILDVDNFSVTIVENVILFIPFGLLIPIIFSKLRNALRVCLLGFASSMVIETLQLVTKRGYFDVDDIILNTIGALVGYMLFAGIFDGYYGVIRRVNIESAAMFGKTPILTSVYDRFALTNEKVLLVVQAFPVVSWYLIIMGFSSNNGYESGYLSKSLLYLILVSMGGPTTLSRITDDLDKQVEFIEFAEAILRKLAHMFEYAVLAILVWAMLYSMLRIKKTWAYNLALVAVSATGMIDELNQMTVVGRTGTYIDVIIDLIGASVAMMIITLIMRRYNIKCLKKYQKS